jgi:hypothetical protein
VNSISASRSLSGSKPLRLVFDADWVCAWPRPYGRSNSSEFSIDGGSFPWATFTKVAQESECACPSRWSRLLLAAGIPAAATIVSFHELLWASTKHQQLRPLCGQLVLWMSHVLEAGMGDQCAAVRKGAKNASDKHILFKARSWTEMIGHGGIEAKLAQYVSNCVEESVKHDTLCIAVD